MTRLSTFQQLLILWLASGVIVTTLLAIRWRGADFRFFWLLPYPAGVRGFVQLVLQIFRADPFIATALSVIGLAVMGTLGLLVSRLIIHRAAI